MKTASLLALALLLLSGFASGSAAGPEFEEAWTDLGSPFYEARRRAVRRLAEMGPAAEKELRDRYGASDFRTRGLILEAFLLGRPEAGLDLVYADLDTPNRELVHAQRKIVSAVYGKAREFVSREVAPRIAAGEWQYEEHLRMLPGPARAARAALGRLLRSRDPRMRTLGRRLRGLVRDVDDVRVRIAEIRKEGDPERARRAGELQDRLLRHDTERAIFAVYDAGGRNGSYRGLYGCVRAFAREREDGGARVVRILLSMVKDRPLPEAGVPAERAQHYPYLEPPPVGLGTVSLRILAADCLGDVGDAATAAELAAYFEELPRTREIRRGRERLEEEDLVTLSVAESASALGEFGPLREWYEWFENWTTYPWSTFYYLQRKAQVLGRLERNEEAVTAYWQIVRYALGETSINYYNYACALSRNGEYEEAVQALRRAHELGYTEDPEQLVWMGRDVDLEATRQTESYRRFLAEVREYLRKR